MLSEVIGDYRSGGMGFGGLFGISVGDNQGLWRGD